MKIPKTFPVKPLRPGEKAKGKATCGNCGRSWDDSIITSMTPAPSARCPFEAFHNDEITGLEMLRCTICPYATNSRKGFREHKAIHRPVSADAVELLRRGLECGVFDDAPVFKADVVKLLEGK